jgi:CRP-like cAMP-binding protein
MLDVYFKKLEEISPLTEETRAILRQHINIKKFRKGEYILNFGEVCRHIYFVNSGFIRIFYYKNGKNITEWFAGEKHFFFSITSYFDETPSNLIIEAIEDTEVILLSKMGLEKYRRTNFEIANLNIEFFSGSLKLSQKRMESLQFETAKQRYFNLLKVQPKILNKIPLQYIASFLGITQETLSRIRANL